MLSQRTTGSHLAAERGRAVVREVVLQGLHLAIRLCVVPFWTGRTLNQTHDAVGLLVGTVQWRKVVVPDAFDLGRNSWITRLQVVYERLAFQITRDAAD